MQQQHTIRYILTRTVTMQECTWLKQNLQKGEYVYKYKGYDYDCISPNGIACTIEAGKAPFFELPGDALAITV